MLSVALPTPTCAPSQRTKRRGGLRAPLRFKETSMSKRARKSSKPEKPKAYVLLGANEYAKPRGARFSADADPELLAKAADVMHLWLIEVTNDELAELAARLPAGRLHASGGGL